MAKKEAPLNLVCVSGMQGTGKDTLINDLLQSSQGIIGNLPFKLIHYKKCEMTTFEDLMERQIRRIAKHAIDWMRATKLAIDNPDTIVIMDRCYCDAIVYIDCFEILNWITVAERDYLHDLLQQAFDLWDTDSIEPFFLNPPLAFVEKNLKIRAEEGKAKWKEDNSQYLTTLYRTYNYSISKADPWNVIGCSDSNDLNPGYECMETSRVSRILLFRNHIVNQWRKHIKNLHLNQA